MGHAYPSMLAAGYLEGERGGRIPDCRFGSNLPISLEERCRRKFEKTKNEQDSRSSVFAVEPIHFSFDGLACADQRREITAQTAPE